MEKKMKTLSCLVLVTLLLVPSSTLAADAPLSEATTECLDCHASIHPGIVHGWQSSRHAATTPQDALAVDELARKVSNPSAAQEMPKVAVGCAECHTLRPEAHADTFEHNGYDIHVVVSPDDCKACHLQEVDQFAGNLMANAFANLDQNALYQVLVESIIGHPKVEQNKIVFEKSDDATRAEACYYCHGTKLAVTGTEVRDTEIAGELEFPIIDGWPNQGVGRLNLDGSKGSCSACHTRHAFSIAMALKPYTCQECHIGPDVPVYKVYASSKHGNIFATMHKQWDFNAVPWTVGQDFTAPPCAACHMSLLVDTAGNVVQKGVIRSTIACPGGYSVCSMHTPIRAHPTPQSFGTKTDNPCRPTLPAVLPISISLVLRNAKPVPTCFSKPAGPAMIRPGPRPFGRVLRIPSQVPTPPHSQPPRSCKPSGNRISPIRATLLTNILKKSGATSGCSTPTLSALPLPWAVAGTMVPLPKDVISFPRKSWN